ncbi:ATP synthase F0 subunit B [Candidatus Saccharibacteria bacterium]|nr:ATP synthase F0 subunit B [Candidatus Saccharibacteria bacterium]
MEYLLIQARIFGATSQPSGDLMSSLGIDWFMLGFQTLAFLLLLFILKKFVYPPLVAMLDKRDESIKASADAAMQAEQQAAESEARTAEMIDQAKREAAEIVATAKQEATDVAESIHDKAEARAEALIVSARDELNREVESAKKSLKQDTIELVALATGKVLEEKIDSKQDNQIIEKALRGIN